MIDDVVVVQIVDVDSRYDYARRLVVMQVIVADNGVPDLAGLAVDVQTITAAAGDLAALDKVVVPSQVHAV